MGRPVFAGRGIFYVQSQIELSMGSVRLEKMDRQYA